MNKIQYGAYDLHLAAHQTPRNRRDSEKWTASATITRWNDGDSVAMAMAWGTEFQSRAQAIDYALGEAKTWADANPPVTLDQASPADNTQPDFAHQSRPDRSSADSL